MQFNTKFDLMETFWTINGSAIVERQVCDIRIATHHNLQGKLTVQIHYKSKSYEYLEEMCYASKEEAAKVWLEAQGLNCGLH